MRVDPLRLSVPDKCPFCGAGRITLETTIRGSTAWIAWCCTKCDRDWPVTEGQKQRRTARKKTLTPLSPAGWAICCGGKVFVERPGALGCATAIRGENSIRME